MVEPRPQPAPELHTNQEVIFGGPPDAGVDGTTFYLKTPVAINGQEVTEIPLLGRGVRTETGLTSAQVQTLIVPHKNDQTDRLGKVLLNVPIAGEKFLWDRVGGLTLMVQEPDPADAAKTILRRIEIPRDQLSLTKPEAPQAAPEPEPAQPVAAPETQTQPAPAGEQYPRYVDTGRQVTRATLESDAHWKDVVTKTDEVIHEAQQLRIILDDLEAIPQIAAEIREVGLYSQPDLANQPSHKALVDALTARGLNHDEALVAMDYLLDRAIRVHNEARLNAWSQSFQQEHGTEATRNSILDMVERGTEGNIHFTQDAVEMNMTQEDLKAGYQDLRAVQLVADRLLETYNPNARATWVQNGEWTAEGIRARDEYMKFLSQVMRGQVPAGQEDLANRLRAEYAKFKQMGVEDAVAGYRGYLPSDAENFKKSVTRWSSKKGVVPYEPGNLDFLLTKGLSLMERRIDYPSDLQPTTNTFFLKALQEKPRGRRATPPAVAAPPATVEPAHTAAPGPTEPPAAERLAPAEPRPVAEAPAAEPPAAHAEPPAPPPAEPAAALITEPPTAPGEPLPAVIPAPTPIEPAPPPPAEPGSPDAIPVAAPPAAAAPRVESMTELHATVVASKAQTEHTGTGLNWRGKEVQQKRTTRELIEGKAAEFARMMLEEVPKKWNPKAMEGRPLRERIGRRLATAAERVWKGMFMEMPHYIKEKRHAIKLFGATGLEGDLPYELFQQIDTRARTNVAGQRNTILKKAWHGLGDMMSEITARERDLHRERIEVATELRTQFEQNPFDTSNPLRAAIMGDYAAQDELAGRVSDGVRDAIGEKRTETEILLAKDSKPSQFINREIIQRMLENGLTRGDGTIDGALEVQLRTKLTEYWLSKEFQDWRSSLPAAEQAKLDLSLSYASDIVTKVKELVPTVLAARDHGLAVDQLEFNIHLTLGTAKFGPNGEVPSQGWGEKRIQLNERIWKKLHDRSEQANRRQGIFGSDTVGTGVRRAYVMAAANEVVRSEMWAVPAWFVTRAATSTLRGSMAAVSKPLGVVGGLIPGAVSASVAGTMAGFREFQRLQGMRGDYDMQEALGYKDPAGAMRRIEQARFAYHKIEMGARADVMEVYIAKAQAGTLTQAEALALLGLTADSDARVSLEAKRGINLTKVTTLSAEEEAASPGSKRYQAEQRAFDKARAEAKVRLTEALNANAALKREVTTALGVPETTDVKGIITSLTNVQRAHLETGATVSVTEQLALGTLSIDQAKTVVAQNRAFESWRRQQGVKRGLVVGAGSLVSSELLGATQSVYGAATGHGWTWHGAISGAFESQVQAPVPPQGLAPQPVPAGFTNVHVPQGTTLELNGHGAYDLVDATTHKPIAADLFDTRGSSLAGAADRLRDAHIIMGQGQDVPIIESGTYFDNVVTASGTHTYSLPGNAHFVEGADHRVSAIEITLPNGKTESVPSVFDLSGNIRKTVAERLEADYHLHVGATSPGETIIGNGLQSPINIHDLGNGHFAQIQLPQGVSAHLNAHGDIDGVTVDATHKMIPVSVDANGHLSYNSHDFDAAGIHGFKADQQVLEHNAVIGHHTVTTTEPGGTIDENKYNLIDRKRVGWYENYTDPIRDAKGNVLDYRSEGNELSMHLSVNHDGTITLNQDFVPPTATGPLDPNSLVLSKVAETGHMAAHVTLNDGKIVEIGHMDAHGNLVIDPKNPAVAGLFSIGKDGKTIETHFKFLEVVQDRGKVTVAGPDKGKELFASLSTIRGNGTPPPTLPPQVIRTDVPDTKDIFKTILRMEPLNTTKTLVTPVGSQPVITLTPEVPVGGALPEDLMPAVFGGPHRPLEAPEGKPPEPTPPVPPVVPPVPPEYPVEYPSIYPSEYPYPEEQRLYPEAYDSYPHIRYPEYPEYTDKWAEYYEVQQYYEQSVQRTGYPGEYPSELHYLPTYETSYEALDLPEESRHMLRAMPPEQRLKALYGAKAIPFDESTSYDQQVIVLATTLHLPATSEPFIEPPRPTEQPTDEMFSPLDLEKRLEATYDLSGEAVRVNYKGFRALLKTNEVTPTGFIEGIQGSRHPPDGYIVGAGIGNIFSMLDLFHEQVPPKGIIAVDTDLNVVFRAKLLRHVLRETPTLEAFRATFFPESQTQFEQLVQAMVAQETNPQLRAAFNTLMANPERQFSLQQNIGQLFEQQLHIPSPTNGAVGNVADSIRKNYNTLHRLARENKFAVLHANLTNPEFHQALSTLPGWSESNNVLYLSNIIDHVTRRWRNLRLAHVLDPLDKIQPTTEGKRNHYVYTYEFQHVNYRLLSSTEAPSIPDLPTRGLAAFKAKLEQRVRTDVIEKTIKLTQARAGRERRLRIQPEKPFTEAIAAPAYRLYEVSRDVYGPILIEAANQAIAELRKSPDTLVLCSGRDSLPIFIAVRKMLQLSDAPDAKALAKRIRYVPLSRSTFVDSLSPQEHTALLQQIPLSRQGHLGTPSPDYEQNRRDLLEYLHKIEFDQAEKIYMLDIGVRGTSQNALRLIRPDKPIEAIYISANVPSKDPEKFHKRSILQTKLNLRGIQIIEDLWNGLFATTKKLTRKDGTPRAIRQWETFQGPNPTEQLRPLAARLFMKRMALLGVVDAVRTHAFHETFHIAEEPFTTREDRFHKWIESTTKPTTNVSDKEIIDSLVRPPVTASIPRPVNPPKSQTGPQQIKKTPISNRSAAQATRTRTTVQAPPIATPEPRPGSAPVVAQARPPEPAVPPEPPKRIVTSPDILASANQTLRETPDSNITIEVTPTALGQYLRTLHLPYNATVIKGTIRIENNKVLLQDAVIHTGVGDVTLNVSLAPDAHGILQTDLQSLRLGLPIMLSGFRESIQGELGDINARLIAELNNGITQGWEAASLGVSGANIAVRYRKK